MTLVWHLSWNWCNTEEEFVEQMVSVSCLYFFSYTASPILPLQTAAYTTDSPTIPLLQCLSYDASPDCWLYCTLASPACCCLQMSRNKAGWNMPAAAIQSSFCLA